MSRTLQDGLQAYVPNNRLAYVFYATDDSYAKAVLVVFKFLCKLGTRKDVDFIVIHLEISPAILTLMRSWDMITIKSNPLRFVYDDWYRDCLTKLRVFQLTQYERVIYLDADTLPLCSLDHLFNLPENVTIAAPRAYWLQQPFVTSFLMVVNPSLEFWTRVKRHFDTAKSNRYYDMDIINLEFGDELFFLDDKYGCITKEWESQYTPYHFGDPAESIAKIPIVHFSTFGKPWYHTTAELRHAFPDSHAVLQDLWSRLRAEFKSATASVDDTQENNNKVQ